MTKIKICGLMQEADVCMVNRCLPDYAGFVFAKSRRQVTEAMAERMCSVLDKRIVPVGVFVNADRQFIVRLVSKGIIKAVQLHGDEDEEYIGGLRELIPDIPLIKAVRVRSRRQILQAESLDCDYLLLDTYTKDVYGGSGQQFDKTLIPRLDKPFFLAGGLSAGSIEGYLSICSPYTVDVSSAVETGGHKDEGKIKEFVERVRCYEYK